MKNLFEQSRSHWVRYDHYELKTAADGKRYITPAKDAKPDVYNPMKEMPGMVLDALNVGMLMMGRRTDVDVETAILEFVTKYGLFKLISFSSGLGSGSGDVGLTALIVLLNT